MHATKELTMVMTPMNSDIITIAANTVNAMKYMNVNKGNLAGRPHSHVSIDPVIVFTVPALEPAATML